MRAPKFHYKVCSPSCSTHWSLLASLVVYFSRYFREGNRPSAFYSCGLSSPTLSILYHSRYALDYFPQLYSCGWGICRRLLRSLPATCPWPTSFICLHSAPSTSPSLYHISTSNICTRLVFVLSCSHPCGCLVPLLENLVSVPIHPRCFAIPQNLLSKSGGSRSRLSWVANRSGYRWLLPL